MLFVLIKNELIKLLRKSKTWIVFGLFAVLIGITIFAQYKQDENIRMWNSPKKQLEMANDNLNYYKNEKELNANSDANPEYVNYVNEQVVFYKEQVDMYMEILKKGVDENAWKVQLNEEIRHTKENLKHYENYEDEWSKRYKLETQERLDMLLYYQENNIEPLYGWEYEGNNYIKSLMQFLGMAILLCGIAVFMSDIVSGECTPATLKFLLIQPVTRGKVLLSKFIAVTLTVITMIVGGEIIGFIFVSLTGKLNGNNYPVMIGKQYEKIVGQGGFPELVAKVGSGHMGTNIELFSKAILFQVLFIVAACSVVFLISTLIKSSMITMAISVVITVFLTIGSQVISVLKNMSHLIFVNYADAIGVLTGSSSMMYSNANINVNTGVIVLVVTIVISYSIAHINFSKKDILI